MVQFSDDYNPSTEKNNDCLIQLQELLTVPEEFFWMRSPLALSNVEESVKNAISEEKTRRRVVLNRLLDLVTDARSMQKD
jgi:hypothetical protein